MKIKKQLLEILSFALVILLATVVKECMGTQKKKAQFESYLFIDEVGTLHTSSKCEGIKPPGAIESFRLEEIQKSHLQKFCSRCMTEEQLEELTNKTGE